MYVALSVPVETDGCWWATCDDCAVTSVRACVFVHTYRRGRCAVVCCALHAIAASFLLCSHFGFVVSQPLARWCDEGARTHKRRCIFDGQCVGTQAHTQGGFGTVTVLRIAEQKREEKSQPSVPAVAVRTLAFSFWRRPWSYQAASRGRPLRKKGSSVPPWTF